MALPDMIVRIGLDSGEFLSRMNEVKKEIGSVSKSLSGVNAVGQSLQSLGTSLSLGLTVPLAAFGIAAVDARSKIEQIEMGLSAVSGSASETARMLDIVKQAARLPGLTFESAAQGAVNLRAVGFSADQTQRILTTFGNALAIVGRGGEDLTAVVVQLTQMASKSKIVAGDLKPILERVPQAVSIIKQAFGTIDTEELQKKKINAQDFIEVILSGLEKLPPAASTARNEFDNARDSIMLAMADIGKAIAPVAVMLAQQLVPAVQTLAGAFASLPSPLQQGIAVFGLFAAAIGPIIFGLGQLLVGVKTVAAGVVALQGAIASSAAFTAFAATLKGLTIAAGAAVAPFALLALKIAAIAAIVGGAVYGIAKLGQAVFGAGSNFDWLAKKIEGAFGAVKSWISGSGKAEESTKKLGSETTKLAKSTDDATKQALEHAEQTRKQEEAAEAAKKAAEEWRKQLEAVKEATVKHRTEMLAADVTWRAIIKSVSDSVKEYDKAKNALIEYKARQMEGKDATWAIAEASKGFDEALGQIAASASTASEKLKELSQMRAPELVSALGSARGGADELSAAFKTLGIETSGSLRAKKEEAERAYAAIKDSGLATAGELKRAELEYLKAVADEQKALTGVVSRETQQRISQLSQEAGQVSSKFEESFQAVSTAISNSAQKMVGILIGTESGSVFDALKQLGAGIASALVEPWLNAFGELIENGVKKLIAWLVSETGLKGAIAAVGGWIGGLFGAGAGAAGAAGAAAGAAGSAAAGAAGSAAAGAAGSAAAGAAGAAGGIAAGLIGGGIAAVGSIIGSFITSAKLGGDLGKIEENTRYTQIALIGSLGVIDIMWGMMQRLWEQRDLLLDIRSSLGWSWELMSQAWPLQLDRLAEVRDRVVDLPDRMRPLSITVEGNVIGNEDFLDYLAEQLGKRLALQGA